MQNDLKNIIESLLFVSDSPIDIRVFRQIIPDADAKEIREVLGELAAEYEARQGGFLLSEVAGGFQFRTRPEYKEWIKKLLKPSPVRLSKAALETLAIIAYHQPIIRADVERIRGVDSGAIIRSLLERKLVRILGKKDIPGRPLIYATTRKFLEIFNLKSLSEMPTLKEIQEFGQAGLAEEPAVGPEPPGEEPGKEPADQDAAAPEAEPTASESPDENGPETEAAAPDPETGPETDGTFSRQSGMTIPENEEATPGEHAPDTVDETHGPDKTESTAPAGLSDAPVSGDQEMDTPKSPDATEPAPDTGRPENDKTDGT